MSTFESGVDVESNILSAKIVVPIILATRDPDAHVPW